MPIGRRNPRENLKEIPMKIIGGLIIAFGVVDMLGSWGGLDVWGDWIGVQLPDAIWMFTAYIEIGIGYFLYRMGGDEGDEAAGE